MLRAHIKSTGGGVATARSSLVVLPCEVVADAVAYGPFPHRVRRAAHSAPQLECHHTAPDPASAANRPASFLRHHCCLGLGLKEGRLFDRTSKGRARHATGLRRRELRQKGEHLRVLVKAHAPRHL